MIKPCPFCGCGGSYRLKKPRVRRCKACHKDFSDTSRTEMHNAKVSTAVYTEACSMFKLGTRTTTVARVLGINYRTAWRLRQIAIRAAQEA